MAVRTRELLDTRVLGAVRFVDAATGSPIRTPLDLSGEGARFVPKRLGLYVLASHPAFEDYERSFSAPRSAHAPGSVRVDLRVDDPGGRYLPRRFALRLPRDPDPTHSDRANWLFAPEEVPMYPAPAAPVSPGWAVVRATVREAGTGRRLPGALIRVLDESGERELAVGQADWRGRVVGEAMVPVVGVPATLSGGDGDGEVVVREIDARLEAVFDPEFDPAGGDLPDPEQLAVRRSELPSVRVPVRLASGRILVRTLSVPPPEPET